MVGDKLIKLANGGLYTWEIKDMIIWWDGNKWYK